MLCELQQQQQQRLSSISNTSSSNITSTTQLYPKQERSTSNLPTTATAIWEQLITSSNRTK
jgi:hypothetical protein